MSLIHIQNLNVSADLSEVTRLLHQLNERTLKIMATQAELAAQLNAVTTQVAKIGTETSTLLQKVTDLEAAIANAGNTTPEVDAALAALKAQAQVVDDLVPDAPAP